MKRRSFGLSLAALLCLALLPIQAQSLADLAKQEKEKRGREKKPSKVYTNEDLQKYSSASGGSSVTTSAPAGAPEVARPGVVDSLSGAEEERAWSKRFIEAKARLQQAQDQSAGLQTKLNDLNLNLYRQTDIYDRENLYGPLIAQARQEIERNKEEITAAQQALEELREELRKSGHPLSWENSQLALQPEAQESKPGPPPVKDQKYWQEQLSIIDKRFNALITPLEAERFQLVNRRPALEGESLSTPDRLGLGVPPRVIDIDVQLKELRQKRDQERSALIEQAIREGALPGWFR